MENKEPEDLVREVIDTCAGCDFCSFYLEDTPCLLFPELYRLYHKERCGGEKITPYELRHLVDLCNGCAICPCNIIRFGIRMAKNAFVFRDGLNRSTRFLEHVDSIGRICGALPVFISSLLKNPFAGKVIKHLLGIHEERQFPVLPKEDFNKWLDRKGHHFRSDGSRHKVAYFTGCTGRYFFPDVPEAVVKVLVHNNVEVLVPEQECCGMPPFLEGDQPLTLSLVTKNVERIYQLVEDGWDIICSCPTCGYMLKELWKDEHYFGPISRQKRLRIASKTVDLGEYLRRLHQLGEFKTDFTPIAVEALYYAPCHLRTQGIGEPYATLLESVPQLKIKRLEDKFYCCGMAGIMGYKREFHDASIDMGQTLIRRIQEINPEMTLTDCLSCRLQFENLLHYPVRHPVQMLERAYNGGKGIEEGPEHS
jgi:glycerol-3-phosphate dehydrogenase subunit C